MARFLIAQVTDDGFMTENLDFPTPNLNYFLKDDQIRPYLRDERHDIAAANAPRKAPNEFIIFNVTPPKNQVIIIKSIATYVMRRTDVGDPVLESFEMIPALLANGYFLFKPLVQNQAPFVIETDVNAPAVMAFANDQGNRQRGPGFTQVSDNPIQSILFSRDNTFSILVCGDQQFTISMLVLSVNTVGGIPNPFTVGNPPIPGPQQKRVDFAGALVYGVTMPESLYSEMNKRWLNLR